jgi:hypothetical protein
VQDALGADRAIAADDRPWLVNLLEKRRYGVGGFVWTIRDAARSSFFADVAWLDRSQGESRAELRHADSAFARRLRSLEPRGRFLRFYVWSDSFEVYLEARYVAEAMGFDVSWLAIDAGEEVGINLLGGPQRRVLLD